MPAATRIDLPKTVRAKSCDLLNAALADLIDLGAQAKQAHWNVKGPQFIALHELFDSIAGAMPEHIDTVAERITALGGVAEGELRSVAKRSRLERYPAGLSDGLDHVAALASAVATAGKAVREAIDKADDLDDVGTADLFTGISRDLDKKLWFL